jgi:hypothetical protein
MANYQVPKVPRFAMELDPAIVSCIHAITGTRNSCGMAVLIEA